MPNTPRSTPEAPLDELIDSAEAQRLVGGRSKMTLWRWARDGIIPEPITIRRRNYWRRGEFLRALAKAAAKPDAA